MKDKTEITNKKAKRKIHLARHYALANKRKLRHGGLRQKKMKYIIYDEIWINEYAVIIPCNQVERSDLLKER
jgi:hypothetical protein